MIAIEFEHRLDEHLRASRLFCRKKSWFARADKGVAVLAVLFGAVTTALVGLRWWTAIWFVVAVVEWFDLLSITPLVVRYAYKRTAKFHERTTLTFADECIGYQTPSVQSTLAWDLFSELVEDDQLFLLLYKAPRSYAVVPKRAFSSEADVSAFRELARRNLAGTQSPRSARVA